MTSAAGTVSLGTHSWPGTAMGAREFLRTHGRRSDWASSLAEIWLRWCEKAEPGMRVQTSGTTGSARSIVHSRNAVLSSVRDTLQHWWLPPGSRAVLTLPTTFVAGQAMVIRALEGKWNLQVQEPSSRPSWEGKVDFVALTPHQASGWVQEGQGEVRILLLGGGPVSGKLITQLVDSNRVDEIWESFGLSETITHVATRRLMSPQDVQAPFLPLPGSSVEMDDAGCAVIDSPGRDVSHLLTNDCIQKHPSGGFLWLGRADDVVNTGGVLVHPNEVERAFESFMPSWISDCVAYGQSDEVLGEALVLRLHGNLPEHLDLSLLLQTWREKLKDLLGSAKAPRRLEWGAIPRTERGKIKRRSLGPLPEESVSSDLANPMKNKPVLVFATHNENKVQELNEMLGGRYEIKSLTDIGCHDDILEDAPNLEGNARKKAHYVRTHYGFDCFADDTGLEVEALDGAPGVRSARYAGSHGDSEGNMSKLLSELESAAENGRPSRHAQFRTAICLLHNGEEHMVEGTCQGTIAATRSGAKGFGYDPIFIPEGETRTFAEMSVEEKNKISHRGRAVRAMVQLLRSL